MEINGSGSSTYAAGTGGNTVAGLRNSAQHNTKGTIQTPKMGYRPLYSGAALLCTALAAFFFTVPVSSKGQKEKEKRYTDPSGSLQPAIRQPCQPWEPCQGPSPAYSARVGLL